MLLSWECWVLVLTTLPVFGASADDVAGKLRAAIEAHDPGSQVVAPGKSPVSGMYLTIIDGVSGYVSADGRYFIVGDMLDRHGALTRATRRETLNTASSCSDAVIAKHYALGQQLGIPGTPMIVLSDGASLGGYMAPDKLLAVLDAHVAGAVRANSHEQ